jgi:MFS family permease
VTAPDSTAPAASVAPTAPTASTASTALGGVTGLGVAAGPVVGGAMVQGISWQWIF